MKEMFFMYKEHEMYFNEMMAEDYNWKEFVAFTGNWDYLAQNISATEHKMMEAEKAKCDISEVEKKKEFGVYLTPYGETEHLKKMDMHIQFYNYLQKNDIDFGQYMCDKMCDKAIAYGWADDHYWMEDMMDEDTAVAPLESKYPEFVYAESDSVSMQAEVTKVCHAHMKYFMGMHSNMTTKAIDQYIEVRDLIVDTVDEIWTMGKDRANMEAGINKELERVHALRKGQWTCEFDVQNEKKHGYLSEQEFNDRMTACANSPAPWTLKYPVED